MAIPSKADVLRERRQKECQGRIIGYFKTRKPMVNMTDNAFGIAVAIRQPEFRVRETLRAMESAGLVSSPRVSSIKGTLWQLTLKGLQS